MRRQFDHVRQSRWALSPLGKIADRIAGTIRSGLDRLTGTAYPVPDGDDLAGTGHTPAVVIGTSRMLTALQAQRTATADGQTGRGMPDAFAQVR